MIIKKFFTIKHFLDFFYIALFETNESSSALQERTAIFSQQHSSLTLRFMQLNQVLEFEITEAVAQRCSEKKVFQHA